MSLYLYLNEHWHADTWVNGGLIPISPASTYRSMERSGINTPDENLIHKSELDIRSIRSVLGIPPGTQIRGLTIEKFNLNGVELPRVQDAQYYYDDGLILSFSSRLTHVVARKLCKKACVKILDMDQLKSSFDEQLGVKSEANFCRYTSGHERNHFLKSELDSWQAELRLFWPITNKSEVSVPKGTTEFVCTW